VGKQGAIFSFSVLITFPTPNYCILSCCRTPIPNSSQDDVGNTPSRHGLKRTFLALLPSFIQHRIDTSLSRPTRRILSTSYLDGLRGLAALFVFWYHVDGKYLNTLMPSYGPPLSADSTRARSSFLQLPILRVAFSGRPMVHSS
jgi:hypothetical protein